MPTHASTRSSSTPRRRRRAFGRSVDPKWPTIGRTHLHQRQRARLRANDPQLADAQGRPPLQADMSSSRASATCTSRISSGARSSSSRRRGTASSTSRSRSRKRRCARFARAPASTPYEFGQVERRLTRYNWFGGGRRLDFRAALGNLFANSLNGQFPFQEVLPEPVDPSDADQYFSPTWQASADFTQPWFQSPRNTLGLSAFTHRRSAPAIFVDKEPGRERDVHTHARLTSAREPHLPFRALARRSRATCTSARTTASATRTTSPRCASGRGFHRWRCRIVTDRGDDPLDPTPGIRRTRRHRARVAVTMSDYHYNRISGRISAVQVIRAARRPRLASARWMGEGARERARKPDEASATNSVLHPRKRFYAGGAQSVRGYGENQLGPRVLTIRPGKLLDRALTTGHPASAVHPRRATRWRAATRRPTLPSEQLRAAPRRRKHAGRRQRGVPFRGMARARHGGVRRCGRRRRRRRLDAHARHERRHAGLRLSLHDACRPHSRRPRHQAATGRESADRHRGRR